MNNMEQSFRTILTTLRGLVGSHAQRNPALLALMLLVQNRLSRAMTRFTTLVAQWRAGTLPKPRLSRAGQARAHAPSPHLPAEHGWLTGMLGYQAAGCANQLQDLLHTDEMAEFLAAAPQALRILRPLRRLLGVDTVPAIIGKSIVFRRQRPSRPEASAWFPPPAAPSFVQPNIEFVSGTRTAPPRLPNHRYRSD